MTRQYLAGLTLLAMLVIFPRVAMADGSWIQTDSGCKTWDASPQPNETATWSGGTDNNGYCTGKGILQWHYGNVRDTYNGNLLNGKENGKGVFTWASGYRYEGDYVNGSRTGKGLFTWPNGDRYDGDFVNGTLDGYGTFYNHDGTKLQGHWSNGKYVGP